jgi:hypothetical protein
MPDRLNYSFGMKVPGVLGKYSSIDFHVSLSSDVKPEETPDEAFKRVKGIVEQWSEEEYDGIEEIRKD